MASATSSGTRVGSGIDLEEERARLAWLAPRHPVAEVLDFGRDDHGEVARHARFARSRQR